METFLNDLVIYAVLTGKSWEIPNSVNLLLQQGRYNDYRKTYLLILYFQLTKMYNKVFICNKTVISCKW